MKKNTLEKRVGKSLHKAVRLILFNSLISINLLIGMKSIEKSNITWSCSKPLIVQTIKYAGSNSQSLKYHHKDEKILKFKRNKNEFHS